MNPAVPIVLAVLVIAALAKAKQPKVDFVLGGIPWNAPLEPDDVAATLEAWTPPAGKMPIYKGRPDASLPPGAQWIDVWVQTPEGTYPDPRRFVQHHAISVGRRESERERNEKLQAKFQRYYYVGWIEDDVLHFSVIGRPVPNYECPTEISCGMEDEWQQGGAWNESWDVFRTEIGGTAAGWQKSLGPAWTCRATQQASECYSLIKAPVFDHPRALLSKPKTYGISNG